MTIRVPAWFTGLCRSIWPLLTLLWAGCVTGPQVDWDARLGSYNRAMAIADYGQPTRSFKLSDGSQMLEWVQPGSSGAQVYNRPVMRDSIYNEVPAGDTAPRSLQLTFGPDDKLVDWNRNY